MISAALALWSQARTRHAAADLGRARIPVLLLKGPDLQDRLYGTPVAYPSGDVDILVPRRLQARARRSLVRAGFRFDPSNGVLWRMSAAASYERGGFFLDLHWGLHAGHLPSWCFRSLERDLWANAMAGPHGMLEPDLESLIVFLAVHAAGHRFERGEWSENVRAAAALNPDWRRVGEIARRTRAVGAVRRVMRPDEAPYREQPVLDGAYGRLVSIFSWLGRGHFLPRSLRDRFRDPVELWRSGFGFIGRHGSQRVLGGIRFTTPRGVFRPGRLATELARSALAEAESRRAPVLVEVGTGTGAVALMIAKERPDATVHATELSARAFGAAKRNLRASGLAGVHFYEGDLMTPLPDELRGRVDIVLSNLPSEAAALTGGPDPRVPERTYLGRDADGLGLVRELAADARGFLKPGGVLMLMLEPWQWDVIFPDLGVLGFEPADLRSPEGSPFVYGSLRFLGEGPA
jgi:release factor glutamine methyltransferase